MADRLSQIRVQIDDLQQKLLLNRNHQKTASQQLKRGQQLYKLQKLQKELGERRIHELENTVSELERRRLGIQNKIKAQQGKIRRSLIGIEASHRESIEVGEQEHLPEQEKLEAPRRRVMSELVEHGIKEMEALRVDLADVAQLEIRIQDERHQITFLFHDLNEQESVLELNRQLQRETLEKNRKERLTQLENYRKLKGAESRVEQLISQFNARIELEHEVETERIVSKAMQQGSFSRLKGRLPFPVVGGRVVSVFGKGFDLQSGLHVFKKGVDIVAQKSQSVRSISGGKIAYSGELPNYGRVVIVDHGDHYYSLFGHLGTITKKSAEWVAAGESIGQTDSSGTPLYFEIRSRNVAVNPLQWVAN